jgi:hypothetical protein
MIELPGPLEGHFAFFIFLLEASGLVPRHQLIATAVDLETCQVCGPVSDLILPSLSGADPKTPQNSPTLLPDVIGRCYEAAQSDAFALREAVKEELDRTNEAIAISRQESLKESLRIRGARILELKEAATNDRIRRMREAQLRNLEVRVEARLAAIEEQRVVNVRLHPLAGGYLHVV